MQTNFEVSGDRCFDQMRAVLNASGIDPETVSRISLEIEYGETDGDADMLVAENETSTSNPQGDPQRLNTEHIRPDSKTGITMRALGDDVLTSEEAAARIPGRDADVTSSMLSNIHRRSDFVVRDETSRPYAYRLTDAGKQVLRRGVREFGEPEYPVGEDASLDANDDASAEESRGEE